MRILVLQRDMTPSQSKMISEVRLIDSNKTLVKSWETVPITNGFAQLEYQLSLERAIEGTWFVAVSEEKITDFVVKSIVSTRFRVTLTPANNFNKDEDYVDFILCAKYFDGRPVNGVGIIEAKITPTDNDDYVTFVYKSEKLNNGCFQNHVSFREVIDLGHNNVTLNVIGRVIERDTLEILEETFKIDMKKSNFKVTLDNTIPKLGIGLPYQGYLKMSGRKNGIHMNGKTLKLCYTINEYDLPFNKTVIQDCQNISIDINSQSERIYFTIPPLKPILKQRYILVENNVPNEQPSYMKLQPDYFKNSNSLKILMNDELKNCDDGFTFKVLYTLNNITEKELKFNYLVLSKRDVVQAGYVNVEPKGKPFSSFKFENTFKGEHEFIENDIPLGEVEIKIKRDRKVYGNCKLIVFYTINNAILLDEFDFNVYNCLPKKVDIKWNKVDMKSGEKAFLKISTENDSVCALTGIEKFNESNLMSTKYMNIVYKDHETDNEYNTRKNIRKFYINRSIVGYVDIGIISSEELFTKVHDSTIYFDTNDDYYTIEEDKTVIDADDEATMIEEEVQVRSRNDALVNVQARSLEGLIKDANDGSHDLPNVTISSTKKVYKDHFLDMMKQFQFFDSRVSFWDLLPVNQDHVIIERTMPNYTTTLMTRVVCASKSKGIEFSEMVELNVLKPYYVDVQTPHSIKRNVEILHVPVIVYNNLNYNIPIRVTLGDNKEMELVDGENKKTIRLCIDAGNSSKHIYKIKGLKMGVLNMSFSIESDPDGSENCGNGGLITINELIYKTVKVEAEGYPSKIVTNTLLCGNNPLTPNNVTWMIDLHEGVVNDTTIGSITINTNIFRPVFENLNSWFRVPTDVCNERILINYVNYLYVLKYLMPNNILVQEIKDKISKDMVVCYDIILSSHIISNIKEMIDVLKGGPSKETTFIKAYLIQIFPLMQEYITDPIATENIYKHMNSFTKLFLKKQNRNGCFEYVTNRPMSRHKFASLLTNIINKETCKFENALNDVNIQDALPFEVKGMDDAENHETAALTSYVISSLKKSQLYIPRYVYRKARSCISRGSIFNNYTLSISSYVLNFLDEHILARIYTNGLQRIGDLKNGRLFWENEQLNRESSRQEKIEVAGYALLAFLEYPGDFNYAAAAFRFLQTQMSPEDGYISNRDSIFAFNVVHGMKKFAYALHNEKLDLDIDVFTKHNGIHHTQIKNKNTENTENIQNTENKYEIALNKFPEVIQVETKGDGCVLGQAIIKYNEYKKPKSDSLKLNVSIKSATEDNRCFRLNVTSCIMSNNSKHSYNLAVLEVSMPSGYVPDQYSLVLLKKQREEIKNFELIEDKVVLYIKHSPSKEICTSFMVQEMVVVENRADAILKLFDYFHPEDSVFDSYKLPVCQ